MKPPCLFLAGEFGFQLPGAFFKRAGMLGPVLQRNGVIPADLFKFTLQIRGGGKVVSC
ncbi:hypothetical protein AA0521_2677 [Komagataeibacter intermedius NRIC 0521]|uniref:Uncharacterized protein n=1 Tax=Komagataeibacter intermedius NRIC 0521 TaxID=1307934 RepID=A0ABQ0PLU2_9PROT|nr:hypothetical protein AA0521_2677 [Komagataeibacter intermedius NRIC 0521]